MSLTGILVALVAAWIGGLLDDFEGAVLGALLGYALGAVFALSRRVQKLEQALAAQQKAGASADEAPETPEGMGADLTPPPLPVEVLTAPVPPAAPADWVATTAPADVAAAPPEQAASAPVPPSLEPVAPFASIAERIKAFFTDGNVMVKVGLIVLFIGVGFLLKLAAEHNVFPIELRVASVGLGGLVLLGIGWRLRHRRRVYGLLLQGGGIGIMYLTGFAAARLFAMLPLSAAFGFMLALVVFSALLAVLQEARYLAFYGAAGGFLAPILASTGSGSHVALFSYYAMLNLGIAGIAWYRAWRQLNVLGFAFTFVIGVLWGEKYYRPEFFTSVEPFLVFFFLLFVLIAVLFAWRQPPNLRGYVDATLVFGVPIAGFALQAALVQDRPYGLAFSAFGMSSFYIVLATALWQRRPQGMRLLTEAFLALGVVFASLAIPLTLEGRWTTVAWALEGAALVWIGVRQQRTLARLFGIVLQVGAGIMFLSLDLPRPPLAVFNGTYLGGALISLAGLFASYYLEKHRTDIRPWERFFHIPLLIWGLLWWFGTGEWEILQYVTDTGWILGINVVFCSGSFVLLHLLGRALDWSTVEYPVLGHLYMLGFFMALAWLVGLRHPFQPQTWFAWPLAFAVQYLLLYRWRLLNVNVQQWHHLLTLWALVMLLTWEGSWLVQYGVAGGIAWRDMTLALIPAGSVLFLLTIGRTLPWPVAAHAAWYSGAALVPMMLFLWGYAFCVGLWHPGNPWPLSYVPVLNPVDLVVLFIIFLSSLWHYRLQQQRHTLLALIPTRLQVGIVAIVAFAWFNGMIARTIHHWLHVPYTLYALSRTVEFQTTVSVLWTLVALAVTAFATRKQRRELWFVGAALLAAVIVKLFLIDLKNSNTIARIVSFIVVGVLMLVIGYVSPIPPRRQERQP